MWQNCGMYAILRVQKLKSPVAVYRSMKHTFREQETPNAIDELTPENFTASRLVDGERVRYPSNSKDAMAAFRARLPEKFRKDAVQCIEYLITASPEALKGKTKKEAAPYFADSLKWISGRHGSENIVTATVHMDETTPHMVCYVVPRDGERLNARKWLGGAKALSDMQTDFAERVGSVHGLQRGVQGSRARHQSIRRYYAGVEAQEARDEKIDRIADALGLSGFKKDVFSHRMKDGQHDPDDLVKAAQASRPKER